MKHFVLLRLNSLKISEKSPQTPLQVDVQNRNKPHKTPQRFKPNSRTTLASSIDC